MEKNIVVSEELLGELGFKKTKISINVEPNTEEQKKQVVYKFDVKDDADGLNNPGVYLFTHKNDSSNLDIIYVGKSGKGVNRRMSQHSAGYKSKLARGDSNAGSKIINMASKLGTNTFLIWFRESRISPVEEVLDVEKTIFDSIKLSTYSTEEEALILFFKKIKGENLMNSSIPRNLEENTCDDQTPSTTLEKCKDEINKITQNIDKTSSEYMKDWEDAIGLWSDETRQNFCSVLQSLENDEVFKGTTPKIIGEYSTGPFRNERLLVFGKLVEIKFAPNTNQLYFTLDGKYVVKHPFDINNIRISTLEDFLDI